MLHDQQVERIKDDVHFDRTVAEIIVAQNKRLADDSIQRLVQEIKEKIDPKITPYIKGELK